MEVTYADFSGGEYGRLGGRHAPPHSFTGVNVQRYIDGSLGPRAGLRDLAPTSVPAGTIRGLGWSAGAGENNLVWFIIGTTVYGFSGEATGQAVVAYTGSLDTTPTAPVEGVNDITSTGQRTTYISVDTDDLYLLNHTARTVTKITSDAGGRPIAFYRDVLVSIDKVQGNRLRFSNRQDFTTWDTPDTEDYIDIGDGWEITGLFAQRDHLVITKQDGSIWILTGPLEPEVPSVTLRRLVAAVTPSDGLHEPAHGVAIGDGLLWFLPTYRDHPAFFDGSRVTQLRHLSLGDFSTALDQIPPSARALAVQYPDEVCFISGEEGSLDDNAALLLKERTWTRHVFGTEISSWAATGPTGRILIADSSGASPKFYVWTTDLQRPAIAADTFARVGDDSDTPFAASFTLADFWAPVGMDVLVRRIRVDFRKFDTGAVATNHFDLTVEALGAYENPGVGESGTQTFDEAGTASAPNGTDARKTFGFGDQGYTSGFRIKFENLRGVAIQAVHVDTLQRERTPRP